MTPCYIYKIILLQVQQTCHAHRAMYSPHCHRPIIPSIPLNLLSPHHTKKNTQNHTESHTHTA